jgi:hypothetical protein
MPAYPSRLCSTTEGRQTFPDIMQDAFGLKAITVFHRYGRPLGAAIPFEAVCLLAGYTDLVDEETKLRIRNAALSLVTELSVSNPVT